MLTITLPEESTPGPLAHQRPILVAIRAASASNQALEWAARRALETGAPLVLVHAVPSALLMPPGTDYAAVVAGGRLLLQVEAARLMAGQPTVRVSTYLHCGDVVHALLGLSADAELLVVGADRVDALTGAFKGSVTVEVALGSQSPVLIIPTGYRASSAKNGSHQGQVVAGVDGSVVAFAALDQAAAEAHRLGAALRVVAATRPERAFTVEQTVRLSAALVNIRANYPGLTVSWIVDELRTPVRALLRHSRDASLLVIGRHGCGARQGMTLGSVTHTLLLRPPCPTLVMTLPQPERVLPAPVPGQAAQ